MSLDVAMALWSTAFPLIEIFCIERIPKICINFSITGPQLWENISPHPKWTPSIIRFNPLNPIWRIFPIFPSSKPNATRFIYIQFCLRCQTKLPTNRKKSTELNPHSWLPKWHRRHREKRGTCSRLPGICRPQKPGSLLILWAKGSMDKTYNNGEIAHPWRTDLLTGNCKPIWPLTITELEIFVYINFIHEIKIGPNPIDDNNFNK